MSTFDYTSRDYSTIRSELLSRAGQVIPEWTDRDPSDFMNALIDLWAYSADVLHFYIDRAAGESFLSTATQRQSVLALANLYDYTPNFVNSSTTSVQVTNTIASTVEVPPGTSFFGRYNDKTYSFYSTELVNVGPNATVTIPVREGTLFEVMSVTSAAGDSLSNGRSSQRFKLFHRNVDPNVIDVDVYEGTGQTAVRWRKVDRLVSEPSTAGVYTVYVNATGVTEIIFGNGVNGRIPPANVEIRASYSVSSGESGNLPSNSITSFSSSLYPGLRVVSSSNASGGSDTESISNLKAAIPSVFRTRGRAVTLSDYADIAKGVQGVSKAVTSYAVGPSSTGGSVTVYAVPYQSGYENTAASVIAVPQELRESVYTTLIPVSMLGVATVTSPASIYLTSVYLAVDLYVKSNYVYSSVNSKVVDAIDTMFTFSNVSFGQVLTIGEFYRKILAVDGVDYAVITDFNTTAIGGGIESSGKITINEFKLPKKGGVSISNPGDTGVSPPA